ncbi:sulfite exporter TauE/SafE family protein [Mechercharimyces sp. CAU 1602]|uniref:sulfite exporter TauE/SafE family protein n=1 Tax=Mechercharimyces sp. CAU 1602 TaxID=2973933 RepID=UPI002162D62D|nr:sulfite exporter TauE/SafE family protein [Mechercharimyces sp. CAU 1602]MCS1351834.1 sulfite exporter TauE/SafE family protein [Mechercharimyces sp. CAU 1602]
MLELVVLLLIGLIAGTMGSLVGLGGGFIIVPGLLMMGAYFSNYTSLTPQEAVGTSLTLIVLTALSSTLSYVKQKKVDVVSGTLFFAACGPGAVLGVYIASLFEAEQFSLAFAIFMVFNMCIFFFRKKWQPSQHVAWSINRSYTDREGNIHFYGYSKKVALPFCFIVGVISGTFGVGGGILLVPMMLIIFRFPTQVATSTSMYVILFSSLLGSLINIYQGHILWEAVLFIAPGAWFGGRLGAWLSKYLSDRMIYNLFVALVVLIVVRMVYNGLL